MRVKIKWIYGIICVNGPQPILSSNIFCTAFCTDKCHLGILADVWSLRARERERNLYFSMVTGAHYGTKTPPDQQPTKLSQGYNETRQYLQYVYEYGL